MPDYHMAGSVVLNYKKQQLLSNRLKTSFKLLLFLTTVATD